MAFQRRKVAAALAYAVGVGTTATLLTAAPSYAQDMRVTVTGTNIKRVESETASPVVTITSSQIEQAGYQTINEFLQQIPSAGAGLDNRFVNGFAPGGGSLNLRNLGFNSTLILVNGKRLPTYPFAQILATAQGFQDLNSIPLALVDRIEVLLDGASAIYGADAVAGVVNVITKSNFRGLEVQGGAGTSYKGDGTTWQASITGGWGDLSKDKYNVAINASYMKQDNVWAKDRSFNSTEDLRGRGGTDNRSSFGTPGTLVDTVTGDRVYGPDCGPSTQIGGSSVRGNFCRYDRPQEGTDLLPSTERYGFYGTGQYAFSPALTAFVEGGWARAKYYSHGFPAPTLDGYSADPLNNPSTGVGLIVPVGNPYNPFPNPAELRLRTTDVGTRDIDQSSDIWRVVAGLKGTVKDWDWDVSYYYGKITTDQQNLNQVLQTQFQQAINNGSYNIMDPSKNPASLTDSLRYTAPRNGDSKIQDVFGKISGDIYTLPAGPLSMAIGGEWRRESLSDVPDYQLAIGNTMGISASQAYGDRDVSSFFTEFNIPIVKTFEADAAVRYDKYSGNGSWSGWSPKLGLRWQPNSSVLVRGTVGQAYRAPSLFETTPATQTSYSFGLQDPVLCPVYDENNPNCGLDLKVATSGNANLKPEKTDFLTAGFILEPVAGNSVGMTYWYYKRKDEISAFTADQLLAYFPTDPSIVVRNPDGTIAQLNSIPINLNQTKTSGLDINLRGRTAPTPYGTFSADFTGTYLFKYDTSYTSPTGDQFDGNYAGTIWYPRFKANWALNWNYGAWFATLSGNYTHSMTDNVYSDGAKISSYALWNLSATYTGFKGWQIMGQIQNLFNTDPPFVNESTANTAGWDVQLAQPMGTFFYVQAKYNMDWLK
ncbi:MAG: TonB-dependent receptor [Burkholderiales bacterium]